MYAHFFKERALNNSGQYLGGNDPMHGSVMTTLHELTHLNVQKPYEVGTIVIIF